MTPHRWREITAVFHAALARDAATRESFLEDACKHDPSLRAEVDALVAAHHEAGSFGETPLAIPLDVKRLVLGTYLGAFRIDALLGVGGMGEVYRATDTRLGRAVAIKVLPDSVSSNPDRLARLEREARVLATLNHPHIAAIYGIEEGDGVQALVLELVEGETLAHKLGARSAEWFSGAGVSSRVNEALVIARQIAEALEAAHEKGIVHRDLKPANIALTRDSGVVKVLDFGLAKTVGSDLSDRSEPTMPSGDTRDGMILGTAPYMSPEQARGLPVDKRTDIWAFGCVLYELLSGRQPFSGATITDTVAAILEREPDWRALPAATPPHVRRLLRRALEKNPALRLRDIGDARIELLSGAEDDQAGPAARVGQRGRLASLAAAIGAVTIAVFLLGRQSATTQPGSQETAAAPAFRQLTFRRGVIQAARFDADGKSIVYSASWDGRRPEVFAGRVDGPESRSLGWPAAALFAVSPTNQIALSLGCVDDVFFRGCLKGTLATAPLAGGAPRELSADIKFADWGHNGELAVVKSLATGDQLEFPIGRVALEGPNLFHPRVDPQGRRVAVLSTFPGRPSEIIVIERDGTRRTLTTAWPWVTGFAWSPSGDELWFSGTQGSLGVLQAVTLEGRERPVVRMPASVRLHDISHDGSVLLAQTTVRYVTMIKTPNQNVEEPLSWFDLPKAVGFSADGRLLLFTEVGAGVGGKPTMYLRPTDGASPPVRLGEGAAIALSADAGRVLAVRSVSSQQQLVVVPTGAGDSIVLPQGSIETYDADHGQFFSDGRRVLFYGRRRGEGLRTFVQELPAGEPRPITPVVAFVGRGVISPDGQWVAESTNHPGGVRHMLYPVAGGAPRPIPGARPEEQPIQWSADGSELYMRTIPLAPDLDSRILRLSLRTGDRQVLRTIRVPDRAGAGSLRSVITTRDGRAYAYHYPQMLQDLYLATGLK